MPELAPGCCSATTPCSHQKADPDSICDGCQKAATLISADEAAKEPAVNLPFHDDTMANLSLLTIRRGGKNERV